MRDREEFRGCPLNSSLSLISFRGLLQNCRRSRGVLTGICEENSAGHVERSAARPGLRIDVGAAPDVHRWNDHNVEHIAKQCGLRCPRPQPG